MLRPDHTQNNFSKALRAARLARSLSQEAFSLVSSRTYVSSLERGLKTPTLSKVDDLADVLGIHPLTLLALSYVTDDDRKTVNTLLVEVSKELLDILGCKKLDE
jgi:transcriptional regulator with XRE-family HTH domain